MVAMYNALEQDTNDLATAQISDWTAKTGERLLAIREVERDLFGRRAKLQSELESTLKWNGKLVEAVEGERNEASKVRIRNHRPQKSRTQKIGETIGALLKVCVSKYLVELIGGKSGGIESIEELVEEETSINSVSLVIIDELVKQFPSAAEEVDRWNVETVVAVIKKGGKQLRKGKQVNVHELSSIASSPLPDVQHRAPFSYAPSLIRSFFASYTAKTVDSTHGSTTTTIKGIVN
jgi:hypothetical protein